MPRTDFIFLSSFPLLLRPTSTFPSIFIRLFSGSPLLEIFIASGVGLSPLYCGHFWPIVPPQMIGEGDCGAIVGMKIGRWIRSTRRKPAPSPLCPPQIPLDHTRDRTRAAAVGSQRLTAWAMARPSPLLEISTELHLYVYSVLPAPHAILGITFLFCVYPSPGRSRTSSKFRSVIRAAWLENMLRGIWMDVIDSYFKVIFHYSPEGKTKLWKSTYNIVRNSAEIRNWYL
jgi:hypothetical protein